MTRRAALTNEQVIDMREKMAAGLSVQDCADQFKLPYFTVYQIRRGWTYANVPGPVVARKRGKMTPEKAAKVRALREKGATIKQLAKAAGVGRTTIKRALAGEI